MTVEVRPRWFVPLHICIPVSPSDHRYDLGLGPLTPPSGCQLAKSGRQELANRRSDFRRVRLKCEVAGIEEADDRAGIIAPERLGTGGQEEWIVLAPYGEERRPARP